ncbi:MAG: NAD(P)/FAD-dependent oxidoreductase [Bacteroidetes bacterium]|nr:NAD(P)/FAD-dependent oxidoreductase [Bacteroidota bacterium]
MSSTHTYDVVIVGGGLGGMLCAVILAKEGMKVCVLERDKQIGGCLQTFSLQKKVFDSCVHYVGGLGEGHTLWQILKYAGILDKLSLSAYDADGFDRIAFGDDPTLYPHAIGEENFVEQLLPYFPGEGAALEHYIKALKKVGDHFPLYRLRNGSADEKLAVSGWGLTETLEKITANKKLQNVLAGNNLLYAGEFGKTPFYLHALVLESYIHSAHKVLPGSSQIAKFLWKELQSHGGEVYRNTEVSKLVEENGQISYAETKQGQRFYAKQFIAAVHPERVLDMVDSDMLRGAYRKRIRGLKQTISTYMLNLVLRPGAVPMRRYNIYWNANEDAWSAVNYKANEWPANYAAFFVEDQATPGYAESLSILSYMHYEEVAKWADTINRTGEENERGSDYEIFKEQKAALLLDRMYERIPELKGNIITQSSATPLTYRDYTNSPGGSLYGILKDINKPAETTIATRTKIPNLLLTGQNVNLHGVLGVSITAIATCAELVGMDYLLGRIKQP